MKISKMMICAVLVIAAAFCFTGCGEAAADNLLKNQIVGGWVPVPDPDEVRDEEGNLTQFGVYEFTGSKTLYHLVTPEGSIVYSVNSYQIEQGLFKVVNSDGAQYAKIKINDRGYLVWSTDELVTEFRPITPEELSEYQIALEPDDPELAIKTESKVETAPDGEEYDITYRSPTE